MSRPARWSLLAGLPLGIVASALLWAALSPLAPASREEVF